MAPFPTSDEVRIRPYVPDDAETVWEAVRESMPELMAWMPWCHPAYSIDESRRWIEQQVEAFQARTEFEFAITDSEGQYLGGCGLNGIDAINRRANLGYWVRTGKTRRGVATSAVNALRDWAFAETGLIRLEIVIGVDNAPSRRVAEKSGAFEEARLRRRLLLEGKAVDAIMYAFTREPGSRP